MADEKSNSDSDVLKKKLARDRYKATQRDKAAKFRLEHPDAAKARNRAVYLKHRERIKARARAWEAANPERRKATQAAWIANNYDAYRARANKGQQCRRAAEKAARPPKPVETMEQKEARLLAGKVEHALRTKQKRATWHVSASAKTKAWVKANPERARAWRLDYNAKNKAKLASWHRQWREANLDRVNKRWKTYYAANRNAILAASKDWSAAHPGRVAARVREWCKANPDKARTMRERAGQKRRAKAIDAFVEHVDRRVVYERDKGICGICKKRVDPAERWHVDHVIALAIGGLHCYDNVQLAHGSCNRKKHTSIPLGQFTLWQVKASPGAQDKD